MTASDRRCEECGTAMRELHQRESDGAWVCLSCWLRGQRRLSEVPRCETSNPHKIENNRTRNEEELGTRSLSSPPSCESFLVPSSPSSPLMRRIVEDIRTLRAERRQRPPEKGDPDIVPYALSMAVKRCGAKDKSEAKRAMDALLKAGLLRIAYTLKPRPLPNGKVPPYGLRCYEILVDEAGVVADREAA